MRFGGGIAAAFGCALAIVLVFAGGKLLWGAFA